MYVMLYYEKIISRIFERGRVFLNTTRWHVIRLVRVPDALQPWFPRIGGHEASEFRKSLKMHAGQQICYHDSVSVPSVRTCTTCSKC